MGYRDMCYRKTSYRKVRYFVLVISVLLSHFNVISTASAADVNGAAHTITVQGKGYVDVVPNIVDLRFNLFSVKDSLAEAKKDVDKLYRQALAEIEKFDIDKTDIKLTRINSYQEYEWVNRKRNLKGHRVSRSLTITVRNLETYPDLLQSLVDAGISQIGNASARIDDVETFKRQALKNAVTASKQKASLLASEFGRTLGKVLVVNEGGIHVPRPIVYAQRSRSKTALASSASEGSAPPQESFGTQRISATITAIFSMQ